METTTTNAKPVAREGMRTPWGKADYVQNVAPGVAHVGTPGHGGYKVSRALNSKVHEAWREKGGWYEEDCKYAVVVVTFPSLFTAEQVKGATASLKDYYPDQYEAVTGTKVAVEESGVLKERVFAEVNKDKYVVTSACGDWKQGVPKGFVEVYATKAGSRQPGVEGKTFLVSEEEYATRTRFGFVVDTARHEERA